MNISTNAGVWIGALCTLGFLSFFIKDNPFYRVVESLYVGVVAGHAVILGWGNINNLGLKPLTKGQYLPLIWVLLGVLLYSRYTKGFGYLARIPVSILVGMGAGMSVRATIGSQVVTQIAATLIKPNSLSNILIIVGVVATVFYFFFSFEAKGALAIPSRIGRIVMMVSFGAAFGNTVMGRMSLLIGRLQYLWGTWLGLM
jgi:hypothetical protein